jgi:phosphatidylserine decarboxylase
MTTIIILILIIISYIYFHRKPKINIKETDDNVVLCPAYGTIQKIIETDDKVHVITFLSPVDVHVQYYPVNGIIKEQIHDMSGKYHLAYQLNKSDMNEKVITIIDSPVGEVTVQQIAGYLVRRIETVYEKQKNPNIKKADEMGMIRLGSRVDIILPKENINLLVKEGDKVSGPYTVCAFYTKK